MSKKLTDKLRKNSISILPLLMKFLSYFLFSPFLLILGLDFIFITTIVQNIGLVDIKDLIDLINNIPFFGKDIYLRFQQYQVIKNGDLTNFIGGILFFLTVVYFILDMLVYVLFKKRLKLNTFKIVSWIILFSYIFYVGLLLYFSSKSGLGLTIMIPIITVYLVFVYLSVFLSRKLDYWSDLLLK